MFRTTPIMLATAALAGLTLAACGDDGPTAAPAATASLLSPADGDRIAGALDVAMTATGITIGPAGEVESGVGHFHVIADHGCLAEGTAIGKDADHVHFGTGASTGTIYLEPGRHTLCLQVGDGAHNAMAITDTIDIEVGVTDTEEWCDVVAQVDSLFTTFETSTEAFSAQKPGFENARRLLTQLTEGADALPADVRDDVTELMRWATVMVETMLDAESEEAAAEVLWGPDSILPQDDDFSENAKQWVLDACGVSVA